MNKYLKKILISGASLLMLAGIGSGLNNVTKPAHASMPDPEYFHSTRYHDNVYYKMILTGRHNRIYDKYFYGRMPSLMRQRGHIYPLYYGRSFYKQYGHQPAFHLLHRRGQTYYPDFVEYADAGNTFHYHGLKGNIEMLYIDKRDIGRPFKNQNWAAGHYKMFKSLRYLPVTRNHYRYHARRHARRKFRARRYRGYRHYRRARAYKASKTSNS